MKTLPLLCVLAAVLAVSACDRRETDGNSTTPSAAGGASTDPAEGTPVTTPERVPADPSLPPDEMPPAGPIDPPPPATAPATEPAQGDETQPGGPPEVVTQ